eukprot:418664-Prorocentrum_minimum.AAC.1
MNAMPVFPQYILEEHVRTCTGSPIKVSVQQSVTGRLSIVKSKSCTRFNHDLRLTTRTLRDLRSIDHLGRGFGQSAFNQMICTIHVSCRDVK